MCRSSHFKIYGMDYECQRIFDEAYADDPYYLPSESIFSSNIQGFCLCDEENKIPAASFCCFPYITKQRWRKERLLRITRLLMLPCDGKRREEISHILIQEIYALGKRAGVHAIEVEVYSEINSRIFFPSASCAVNTYNALEWAHVLKNYGFVRNKVSLCFELDLDGMFNKGNYQQIHIRKHLSGDEEDKKLYYELWSASGDCPYNLGNDGFWYTNVFGWPRAWYSEISHLLRKDDYILFAEQNGEAVGFVHWWPNLYPLLREGGRSALFLSESSVGEALDKIEEGKIFKIVVSKKVKNDKDLIEKALVSKAVELMKEKFRFRRCQIANIPRERKTICSFIQENGGKKVHEISLMRSKYGVRFR